MAKTEFCLQKTMPTSPHDFFVVGGTMRPDAPSYIEREADRELFERVLAGDFCYVLTPRQMGKSSLMARTAKRLQAQGVGTAIIDLTQIGTDKDKKSAEQWYYGIAHRILRELDLKANLNDLWRERNNLPALQRLTEFFSDLVLAQTTNPVVIFVDEIDSTIALPSTDDFFAAIRACYNARATEPAYQRLCFVLLGVASPSDLMKDPQRTPFNIGHRIDLTDFTYEEARPLAKGLGADGRCSEQALQRILHWTSGHPYLTQKICQAVSNANMEDCTNTEIDRFVDRLFLSPDANRQDYNLNFIRNRLTQVSGNTRALLKLYLRVYEKKSVADDSQSRIHAELKLSGVVAQQTDLGLRVRNRIYERAFTDEWAKASIPPNWYLRVIMALAFGISVTLIQLLIRNKEVPHVSWIIDAFKQKSFNVSLFLLIIFLGMWIGSAMSKAQPWPKFTLYFNELIAGLAIGLLVGFALTFHQATGILSIGSITIGVVLVFNARKEKKMSRVLAVIAASLCAMTVYWLVREDLGYLLEMIIKDFQ